MSISLLETIERLSIEANAADKRKSKQVAILQDEAVINKALILDMKDEIERLKTESAEALSSSQLCKISNKSLLQELADMEAGLSAVEETNAIMSDLNKALQDENARLKKIERERDVLAKDNKKLKDNLAKAKKVKPAKEKVNTKYIKLQDENAALKRNMFSLYSYVEASPMDAGTMKHETQGTLELIKLNATTLITQEGDEVKDCRKERILVINKHGSVKIVNKDFETQEHSTFSIPRGGVVKIDDSVINHLGKLAKKEDKHKSIMDKNIEQFK